MNLKDEKLPEFIAYEAFLRRAAQVDFPFMLKGSFVTRQYFSNPKDRIPNDLDWVYLHHLTNPIDAEKIFNEWATLVTEIEVDDGVKFQSFQDNPFWRMIDYAMSDDFPTVNTDLLCWVGKTKIDQLQIDISFNLPIESQPVVMLYKPLQGESFTIPQTVPLSTQVAWKLHQTMVRPRFKDIFDLIHLLKHEDFNKEALQNCVQTLVNECQADNIQVRNLEFLINGNLSFFFPKSSIEKNWKYWRFYYESYSQGIISFEKAEHITDTSNLTQNLSDFEDEFSQAMIKAGFNTEILNELPQLKVEQTGEPVENRLDKPKGFFDSLKDLFK